MELGAASRVAPEFPGDQNDDMGEPFRGFHAQRRGA
jgi:hypothetical protein